MQIQLLEVLACPKCKGSLECESRATEIETGELKCITCHRSYPIRNGIPRFVDPDSYASSFGYQWNLFGRVQIDSFNGTTLSSERFWSETSWNGSELGGKWILDAGCGAGRFLDAVAQSGGNIVGLDLSNSVDAAKKNLEGKSNVHFVQASIYELPFKEGAFDYCYCIGVVQHTPEPKKTLRSLAGVVRAGGSLAVTIYPRRFFTKLHSKYLVRPLARRMDKKRLLSLVESSMKVLFPLTSFLFRIPILGRAFRFVIPVANYVEEPQLEKEQRYQWAVLDTFDMLSPRFDQPMTEAEAVEALNEGGIGVRRLKNRGLNLVGTKSDEI
ncbi:MAG: methyltransferase domain-containing protein [Aridibacter famidurans]|nr:methyltransferase domain-containing protein [Aridibacter famidurans]